MRANGYGLLAKLHTRLFFDRPLTDLLGVALLVLVSLLLCVGVMMNQTITAAFSNSGAANTLVLISNGAGSETESFLMGDKKRQVKTLLSEHGVSDSIIHNQLTISTSVNVADVTKFVTLRGAKKNSLDLTPFRLSQGNMFKPERNEVIVGANLTRSVPGLAVGSQIELGRKVWDVVGMYTMKGDVRENEIVGDLDRVRYRYDATGFDSSIRVILPLEDIQRVQTLLQEDLELDVAAEIESEFFLKQSQPILDSVSNLTLMMFVLVIPASIAGLLAIQNAQLTGLGRELKALSFIGFSMQSIASSLFARLVLAGVVASLLTTLVVSLVGDGRAVELNLGLHLMQIELHASQFTYVVIFAVSIGLAALASLIAGSPAKLEAHT